MKDSRTKILTAASRLFYEQGYRATGINQAIAEAEVSKASFYYHFPSKEKLCLAYLHQRHLDWFSWLEQEVNQHEGDTERLLSLFAFLEQWLPQSNFRGCAFLNIASEFPASESEIGEAIVNHKNALRDYIRELVDRLGISTETDRVVWLTDCIYLLFEGAIVESQIHRSTKYIQVAREAVKQLIS